MQPNIQNRTIFCHDNLDVLKGMNSECVDLIYLDPPFNKNKTFIAPIGSAAEGAKFKDWFRRDDIKEDWVKDIKEDDDHAPIRNFLETIENLNNIDNKRNNNHYVYNYCYLAYMARRLIEMQRILKSTGSLYLHCDPTMSHYLKILLDIIFGEKNFRNEIAWHYKSFHGRVRRWFPKKHDILFFYVKDSRNYFFELARNKEVPIEENIDYLPWKKYIVNGNQIQGSFMPTGVRFQRNIDAFVKRHGRSPGKHDVVYEFRSQPYDSIWEIAYIDPKDKKEGVGYPTQKPLALLERIIHASCPEGGIVLDPFCGCATTCVAAEKLGRKWIGIDVSQKAYELVKVRLAKEIKGELKNKNGESQQHHEAMFNWEKEVYFTTTPPKRTDIGTDYREKKYVYIMYYRRTPGEYKVGIAKDWRQRLNSYQTASRKRDAVMPFHLLTPNFREVERMTHEQFHADGEWIEAPLQDIIGYIKDIA